MVKKTPLKAMNVKLPPSPFLLAVPAQFVFCHYRSQPCFSGNLDCFRCLVCIGWDPIHCILLLWFSLCLQQQHCWAAVCGRGRHAAPRESLGPGNWYLSETRLYLHKAVNDQAPCSPLRRIKSDIKWMGNTRINHHSSLQVLYLGKHTIF